MVALLAAATPLILGLIHDWTQKNPAASDDQVKAELQRLVDTDARASQAYAILQADFADAQAKLGQ